MYVTHCKALFSFLEIVLKMLERRATFWYGKMVKQQDLVSLIDEVRQLKTVIQEKDKTTEEVERRLDELE